MMVVRDIGTYESGEDPALSALSLSHLIYNVHLRRTSPKCLITEAEHFLATEKLHPW